MLGSCAGKDDQAFRSNPPDPAKEGPAGFDGAGSHGGPPPVPNNPPPPPNAGPVGTPATPPPTTDPAEVSSTDESPPILRNPPPPSDVPALPRWEEVESGHPEGATNPPSPVLVVLPEGPRCWKNWVGGLRPPDAKTERLGGQVIASAEEAVGTEIVCPMRQTQVVLDNWAAEPKESEQKK